MTFTDSNIKEIIASGKPVFVDFWATWCGPCMAMAPLVEQVAQEYEGRVVVGKYNCDEENDFCSECGVRSLPTILTFKNGERTELRLVGGQKIDELRKLLDKLIAL